MRKRLQSPLFPSFQVHVDRWIPNNLQILCFSDIGLQLGKAAIYDWPRGYKTFYMLNAAAHEIFYANKS